MNCCYKQLEEFIGDKVSIADVLDRDVCFTGIDVFCDYKHGIPVCCKLLRTYLSEVYLLSLDYVLGCIPQLSVCGEQV